MASSYNSSTLNTLINIHTKINKIFQNPNINFFIIMNLILIISCYSFINTPLKYMISSFLSNPIIIVLVLIAIILIGYNNINIAILILLLLFIALFSPTIFNKNKNKKNKIEGFKQDEKDDSDEASDDDADAENSDNFDNAEDDSEDADADNDLGNNYGSNNSYGVKNKYNTTDNSTDDISKSEKHFEKKIKENKIKSRTDSINNIKDVLLGNINKFKSGAENEYKKSLLENKQILYDNELKNNKSLKANTSKSSKTNKKTKEEFQTIEVRKFDPSNEEDTNLLITKEILQDMLNRIEYNYESNTYLKKYVKHRIEEIVDINKLVESDD